MYISHLCALMKGTEANFYAKRTIHNLQEIGQSHYRSILFDNNQ